MINYDTRQDTPPPLDVTRAVPGVLHGLARAPEGEADWPRRRRDPGSTAPESPPTRDRREPGNAQPDAVPLL
jgi:hypothetical protein